MRRLFQSKISFAIFTLAVIILLIFLQSFNAMKPIDTVVTWILNPITSSFYNFGLKTRNFFTNQESAEQLQEENQHLKDQINNLLIEKSKLITENESYEKLSQQLLFIEENQFQSVSASVVGLNLTTESKTFIINKGSNHGLNSGYPVIIQDGILIGRLIDVEPQISKLRLITDSRSIISAQIQNDQSSLGVVEGELGLSLKMTLIPQDDIVETNQLVISSGLDLNIPRGLLVGQITKLTSQTGELFQSATVSPVASLDHISIVSIIVP
ncbi:MAG: rod shape-determining protein MreC [Patescibacteria group bacterium]